MKIASCSLLKFTPTDLVNEICVVAEAVPDMALWHDVPLPHLSSFLSALTMADEPRALCAVFL